MSSAFSSVLAAAELLPPEQRRELADRLLDSIEDSEDPEDLASMISPEWRQEIDRRTAEYEAGLAVTITFEEFKADLIARGLLDG